MRPYTNRQVLGGTVEYGTPTVISSNVISSQRLGPETVYTRYLDRARTEDFSDGDDGDDLSANSSEDQDAWPPTIVPLNDDDARSLTSQKVISQLLSQHAPTLQKLSMPVQAPLLQLNSGQGSRFAPFTPAPAILSPPPITSPPPMLRPAEAIVARSQALTPPIYRPARQLSAHPNALPNQVTAVAVPRDEVGAFRSPRNAPPVAETPRFVQGWEQPAFPRAPQSTPSLAAASPSYAVLGKLPSFGAAPPPTEAFVAPMVTNRGVTITTLGNALSPATRPLIGMQSTALPQPNNGVRSQHIVQDWW